MKVEIENAVLKAAFDTRGAETVGVFYKPRAMEMLWQSDPAAWTGQAPNCFPFTGRLKDGYYTHEGKEYRLPPHGFARDMEFTVTEKSDASVTFGLSETPETLKMYPFRFNFYIKYALKENRLIKTYTVENSGAAAMYFGVGGHPGFIVPSKESALETNIDGNRMAFEREEDLTLIEYDPVEILVTGKKPYGTLKELPLSRSLFAVDALLFANIKSRYVTLRRADGYAVRLWLNDCPRLAFWTPKKRGGFICFEPWWGQPDNLIPIRELKDKEGINALASGKSARFGYEIEIL